MEIPGHFSTEIDRNKAIWEAKEEHIFWFQPELCARSFCLLLAESPQPVRRISFAVRMGASAVADNDDSASQSLSAGIAISPPQARLSSSGCGAITINGRSSSFSRSGWNGNECAASRSSPAVIATDPERLRAARVSTSPRLSARDRGLAGEDRSQGRAICARSGSVGERPEARLSAGQAA